MSEIQKQVTSPCVSICALDQDDVCVGCYRTGDEISQWGSLTDEQRLEVLERVKERETKAYI